MRLKNFYCKTKEEKITKTLYREMGLLCLVMFWCQLQWSWPLTNSMQIKSGRNSLLKEAMDLPPLMET